MKPSVCFLLLCAASYGGATDNRFENTDGILTAPSAQGISGFGMEVLFTKIDSIDHKLMELQLEQRQHRELMESIKALHEKTLATTITAAATTTTTTPRTTTTKPPPKPRTYFQSCKDTPANVSGVYIIRVNDSSPFAVYCEMEKFNGGWIVVQHRFDGSVEFNRNWDQYRDGFGELDKEFWLGMKRIHQLTTARAHEMVIEMKDFSGKYGYARYSLIEIGSEGEKYSLKTRGWYSGTAGDSLSPQEKVRKFSTKDRDNDDYAGGHSAVHWSGAWWYGDGNNSNLNGPYKNVVDGKSIWWYTFNNGYHGLSFTRMMIREL